MKSYENHSIWLFTHSAYYNKIVNSLVEILKEKSFTVGELHDAVNLAMTIVEQTDYKYNYYKESKI